MLRSLHRTIYSPFKLFCKPSLYPGIKNTLSICNYFTTKTHFATSSISEPTEEAQPIQTTTNAQENDTKQAEKPVCPIHKKELTVLRVKKPGRNFGKMFYLCKEKEDGKACTYFKWYDQLNKVQKAKSSLAEMQSLYRNFISIETELCQLSPFEVKTIVHPYLLHRGLTTFDQLPSEELLKNCILAKIIFGHEIESKEKEEMITEILNQIFDTSILNYALFESETIQRKFGLNHPKAIPRILSKQYIIFPLSMREQIESKIKTIFEQYKSQTDGKLNLISKPIPEFVFSVLNSFSKITKSKMQSVIDWSRIPSELLQSAMPFQRKGIEFGIQKEGRVLIADEMGLGKTIQAIGISLYFKEDFPLLIVCPASLRDNWKNEFTKWNHDITDEDFAMLDSSKADPNAKINIVSYDLLAKPAMNEKLLAKKFKIIICDESHFVKTLDSKRTQALSPILKTAKRVIALSGTAALSRPIELYTQFKYLAFPSLKKTDFGRRYCDYKIDHFGLVNYKGKKNLRELNYLLSNTMMIRRLKQEVLKDLPEKRRSLVPLQISDLDVKKMKQLHEKKSEVWKELESFNANTYNTFVSKMYRQTAKIKIDLVKSYLPHVIKEGTKFLVFAHHKVMMDAIEELMKEHSVNYIRIDGKTKVEDRFDLVNKFRYDDQCQVAVLSITACGTGLNFTPCNKIIFAEMLWTPGQMSQCEDRCHRIGQTNAFVDIRYLQGKGTLDDYIWELLRRKQLVVSEALDGKVMPWIHSVDKKSYQQQLQETVSQLEEKEIFSPSFEDEEKEEKQELKILKYE